MQLYIFLLSFSISKNNFYFYTIEEMNKSHLHQQMQKI